MPYSPGASRGATVEAVPSHQAQPPRVRHQQPEAGRLDHRRDLPGPAADTDIFQAINQALRIKTFIGTSENAVRIQIWSALIAMLLLYYLHLRSAWPWNFPNLVALLMQQIFVYRDLWTWLNQTEQPPGEIDDPQLGFAWQT